MILVFFFLKICLNEWGLITKPTAPSHLCSTTNPQLPVQTNRRPQSTGVEDQSTKLICFGLAIQVPELRKFLFFHPATFFFQKLLYNFNFNTLIYLMGIIGKDFFSESNFVFIWFISDLLNLTHETAFRWPTKSLWNLHPDLSMI